MKRDIKIILAVVIVVVVAISFVFLKNLFFPYAVFTSTNQLAVWGASPAVSCNWDGSNKASCSFSGVLDIADQQSQAGFVIGQCYPNCKVPDALVAVLNQPGVCTIAVGGLSLPSTGSIDSGSCSFYNGNTGGLSCIFRVHMDAEYFAQASRLPNYPAPQQGTCTFTVCTPNWTCGAWSSCSNSQQIKSCSDGCNNTRQETQVCILSPPSNQTNETAPPVIIITPECSWNPMTWMNCVTNAFSWFFSLFKF